MSSFRVLPTSQPFPTIIESRVATLQPPAPPVAETLSSVLSEDDAAKLGRQSRARAFHRFQIGQQQNEPFEAGSLSSSRVHTQLRNTYFIWIAHDLMKQERIAELETMRNNARAGGIQPHESQLAAYLLMRAASNRGIDGQELEKLRLANDTVEATRAALVHGRGNVTDDIEKSDHLSTYLARASRIGAKAVLAQLRRTSHPTLRPQEYWQILDILARAAGAGNCGEYANASTHIHAPKLRTDETAHLVKSSEMDHSWSELRVPRMEWAKAGTGFDTGHPGEVELVRAMDRFIIDAWAQGAACHADDSEFASVPEDVVDIMSYGSEDGKAAVDSVKKFENRISASSMQRFFDDVVQRLKDREFRQHNTYEPISVLNPDFVAHTVNRIQPNLVTEVNAVGVLRTLGEPIKQAVIKAVTVTAEARKHPDALPSSSPTNPLLRQEFTHDALRTNPLRRR
jgi:hypothetical protein